MIIMNICNAHTSAKNTLMAQWAKDTKQTINQNGKTQYTEWKTLEKIIDCRLDPWDGFSDQSWMMWENY